MGALGLDQRSSTQVYLSIQPITVGVPFRLSGSCFSMLCQSACNSAHGLEIGKFERSFSG